ncbi:MAG TPA: hypothetical protein VLC97_07480, partial [Rhodanobacteraceae bacterium]|nr:hypothetical protein [Rhodanobacteraceae bacterium]
MLSARNSGIFRAAIHILFITALIFAAPFARAAGEGCTPAAHTFCVTNTSDTTDPGSLRAAITAANAAGGTNTIGFNIAGSGVHTIALATQLPAIATDLTIDGFSQPGSVQNTNAPDQGGLTTQLTIEIVGVNGIGFYYECCAGPFHTLTFQGLALHGFSDVINGQTGTTTPKAKINVYGCFIGTKVDGTALATTGNGGTAVRTGYDNAQIGGTQPWQRNLLSGNASAAVLTAPGDGTSSVVIEGNLIGTDATGTVAIANGSGFSNWPAIYIQGAALGVRIGCTGSGCLGKTSRNIISGNYRAGIGIATQIGGTPYVGLEIKGNFIGLGWNGAAVPNGLPGAQNAAFGSGIQVSGNGNPTPAIIGGFGAGEANIIAFNNGAGINANDFFGSNPSYFETRANQVHDNLGPGATEIAIGAFGAEPVLNDAGDADVGSNLRQNWPEIYTAEPVRVPGPGLAMKISYKVTSAPANAVYPIRVDFHFAVNGGAGLWFAQDSYPSAAGQGYVTTTVPITLSVAGPGPWYAFWGPIVAIATSASGYSSEISPVTNDWIFGD